MCVCAQSCPTLCNPTDCSPAGSSVHGILQARILEWVAISSSKGSPRPRDQTHISCIPCTGRRILYHYATSLMERSYLKSIRNIKAMTSFLGYFIPLLCAPSTEDS
ncbi:hypothetical protein R6Z07F_015879 [Ovis aries]